MTAGPVSIPILVPRNAPVGQPRSGRAGMKQRGVTVDGREMDAELFPGFESRDHALPEGAIHYVTAGNGPPLLLLHGYPQNHVMWHRVAPALAERFTMVCPDLRGYGASFRPADGEHHAGMSKRASAGDQVALMRALGHRRFDVVGHDRGARVGHRMALDHADAVARLAVLDIVPTHYIVSHTDRRLAQAYFHWFFLAQPADLPERMIGADPDHWLKTMLGAWGRSGLGAFDPRAVASYCESFRDPAVIHASCEDYRAALAVDFKQDEEDRARRIGCPLFALWGGAGAMGRLYDVPAVWREYAGDVRGAALDCGHFLAEEVPDATVAALLDFFA